MIDCIVAAERLDWLVGNHKTVVEALEVLSSVVEADIHQRERMD